MSQVLKISKRNEEDSGLSSRLRKLLRSSEFVYITVGSWFGGRGEGGFGSFSLKSIQVPAAEYGGKSEDLHL